MNSPERASVLRYIVMACVLLAFALVTPVHAATIAVNTTADELDFIPNGNCSLREAVVTVNEQRAQGVGGCLVVGQLGNADEIIVPAGIFKLTRISSGLADIDQDADNLDLLADVALRGAGAGQTILDGEDIHLNVGVGITGPLLEGGVVRVGVGVDAVISGVTLRNGHADFGGAIYVTGELALVDAAVAANRAGKRGGGIDNHGDLTLRNVTISGNEARAASLPSGNAGGIYNSGSLDALNVTISGNFGHFVGGVLVGQGSSLVILSSVTITDNESPGGSHFVDTPTGGLLNDVAAELVRLENTLIAGNSGPSGEGPDCRGAFDSRGFNLIGDVTDCSGFSAGSNKTGTAAVPLDPVLSALANHGGTTRTHALLAGSPAIDGGPLGILDSCPDTDQRGSSRAKDGDGNGFSHCDIGAYEAPTGTASEANLEISVAAAPDPVGARGTIEYAVTVTNNGPSNATGVSYRLYLPAGSGAVTSLPSGCAASGSSVTCNIGNLDDLEQISHRVAVTAPTTTGTATASVTVSSSTRDPEPADDTAQASIRVVSANSADLAVAINGPTGVEVGENIVYSVTVGNLGPLSSGSNTRVTSFLPSGTTFVAASSGCTYTDRVQCTVGSLALRGTKTVSITIRAPDQPTNLTISALVSDKGGVDSDADNNSASLSVNVRPPPPPSADLAVQLLGPSTAQVGNEANYTLVINNNGPDTAEDTWVTLPLPAGVGIVSLPGLCGANGVVACQLGDMLNGESWTLRLVLRTPTSVGTLQFTASITDNGDSVDPFEANDSANATTTITAEAPPPGADLALSKSAPVQVQSGATFDYTLVVTNNGPDAATAVVISDGLPTEVSVASIPDGCTAIALKLRCEVATLAAGSSSSFTVAVTAPDLAPDASTSSDITVTNTASVAANGDDPDVDDNEDSATTTVTAPKPAGSTSLDIKPHPDAQPSLAVARDETGVMALRFQAVAGAAEAVSIDSVVVRVEGTAGSSGISNVALYLDADEDGVPDQGGLLANGAFFEDDDALTLTLPTSDATTVPAAGSSGYLVVVDLTAVDAYLPGVSTGVLVALLAPFALGVRRRRHFHTALLALIIGVVSLTSCVTNQAPPAKLTHQLVLEAVSASGELSGSAAVVTGVPLKGTVISR